MILWTNDLKRLGFRDRDNRYWRCDRGYGLDDSTHISVFLWTEHERVNGKVACFEFAEFHVTFEVPGHNLHFYYHETAPLEWHGAGHTSTAEIATLGLTVTNLQDSADRIAKDLVETLGGVLNTRPTRA